MVAQPHASKRDRGVGLSGVVTDKALDWPGIVSAQLETVFARLQRQVH
jgi:hypothetical protein